MTITELARKHRAYDIVATDTLITVAFLAAFDAVSFQGELDHLEENLGESLCTGYRWLGAYSIEIYPVAEAGRGAWCDVHNPAGDALVDNGHACYRPC